VAHEGRAAASAAHGFVSALTWVATALALAGLVHCLRPTRKTLLTAAVTIVVAWLSGRALPSFSAAFNAVRHAAPEDKATLLAKSISNTMNCWSFAVGAR
jgi:hypothetical protein